MNLNEPIEPGGKPLSAIAQYFVGLAIGIFAGFLFSYLLLDALGKLCS